MLLPARLCSRRNRERWPAESNEETLRQATRPGRRESRFPVTFRIRKTVRTGRESRVGADRGREKLTAHRGMGGQNCASEKEALVSIRPLMNRRLADEHSETSLHTVYAIFVNLVYNQTTSLVSHQRCMRKNATVLPLHARHSCSCHAPLLAVKGRTAWSR